LGQLVIGNAGNSRIKTTKLANGAIAVKLIAGVSSGQDNLPEQADYATAFAIGASHWQIGEELAVLGYLHSWASNLINAGLRLIPLRTNPRTSASDRFTAQFINSNSRYYQFSR
jgi:urease accessory protein UreF